MVINIIDREFNFLGQIDEYESFIPTKKWHGIGNFELHLNINNTHAEYLQKENIIFTDEKKAYVILYREIDSVTNKLVVKGLELKSYLDRWIIYPPTGYTNYRVNSNVETIMKAYVQATLNRKGIANVVVAENQNRGIQTVYQSRYKNLADELEKLSLASNLSWDIALDLDNKRFIFDAIEGRDVTVNQDALPPAIFAIEYDNIGEQKLTDSKLDYRNTAIVAGQGEGIDRAITVVGEGEGLDSFETFIDARDIENDNDLPARGTQKLSETQEILTFDSRVLTDKNLIYEEDFRLGDIVTIQNNQWNITTDRRITEVTEIYESTGFRLDVAFGESLPTILDMVKKATDTPIVEGGSEGGTGLPGQDGNDGVGIEYQWNGTELGIKREDEVGYQYQDLKGEKGDQGDTGSQGEQGIPGLDGKSLEFHWSNTQLGIRIEGETTYQYINLKGDKGDQGIQGEQGEQGIQGEIGPQGETGKSIEYNWNGTSLGVRVEGESSYQYINLKGEKGDTGNGLEYTWNGTQLGIRVEGTTEYIFVDLKGEKGETGEIENLTGGMVTDALGYIPLSELDLNAHKADDVSQGEVHGLRVENEKLEYYTGTEWKIASGGIPVGNISGLSVEEDDAEITLMWTDPEDRYLDDLKIAEWQGTKIVRKEGNYPVSDDDGVLVVDNKTRNHYATNGYKDIGLTNYTTYYYMAFPYTEDAITVDGANRVTGTPTDLDDPSGSPGSLKLIAGTMEEGFFGEVPASELITGDALASECGISQGISQHSTAGWLKFAWKGNVQFVAKKPIRHSISWDAINTAKCVYGDSGDKTVTVDGLTYKVTLMRASEPSNDPKTVASATDGEINHHSEWNRLMCQIHEEVINKNWGYPNNIESDIGILQHSLGSGNQGMYSNADLIVTHTSGNGGFSCCQEMSTSTSFRLNRGSTDVSDSRSYPSSNAGSNYGWRPVLRLVP